jgi:hypothetical protein
MTISSTVTEVEQNDSRSGISINILFLFDTFHIQGKRLKWQDSVGECDTCHKVHVLVQSTCTKLCKLSGSGTYNSERFASSEDCSSSFSSSSLLWAIHALIHKAKVDPGVRCEDNVARVRVFLTKRLDD